VGTFFGLSVGLADGDVESNLLGILDGEVLGSGVGSLLGLEVGSVVVATGNMVGD